MVDKQNIIPVILAGGSGTRLWPVSRELTPKQLLEIEQNKSLIRVSVERCRLFSNEKPFIVTTEKQAEIMKKELGDTVEYVLEPVARNTAPAIALATAFINKKNPNDILAILPSDQFLDEAALAVAVKSAAETAGKNNSIVLIGVKPSRPETGYGYIEVGKQTEMTNIYEVESFKEKPDLVTAKQYLADGSFLWNAGMFVAPAKVLKKEFEKHLPDLKALFKEKASKEVYEKMPKVSIDFGVIEKTEKLFVVKTNMNWNDLGSWGSLHDIFEKDEQGNHYQGNHVGFDNCGTLVFSKTKRLVTTIGLENIVVVDTEDAILICDKEKSQDVKKIVEELKQRNAKEL